jgi:hypothetical protein
MAVQARARAEAFIGMTGSGKGVSIARLLKQEAPARLLIWDPRDEYGDYAQRFDSLPLLVQAFRKAGPKPIKARFVPSGRVKPAEAFAIVCTLAFEAGHLLFLAEELSEVTNPSWAPPPWRKCLVQGRHRGLHIVGATQRPALIDKTFLGNCTRVRCFQLGYAADEDVMAGELRCGRELTAALATEEGDGATTIRYLERERRPPKLYAGVITIGGSRFDEQRSEIAPAARAASPFDGLGRQPKPAKGGKKPTKAAPAT